MEEKGPNSGIMKKQREEASQKSEAAEEKYAELGNKESWMESKGSEIERKSERERENIREGQEKMRSGWRTKNQFVSVSENLFTKICETLEEKWFHRKKLKKKNRRWNAKYVEIQISA